MAWSTRSCYLQTLRRLYILLGTCLDRATVILTRLQTPITPPQIKIDPDGPEVVIEAVERIGSDMKVEEIAVARSMIAIP